MRNKFATGDNFPKGHHVLQKAFHILNRELNAIVVGPKWKDPAHGNYAKTIFIPGTGNMLLVARSTPPFYLEIKKGKRVTKQPFVSIHKNVVDYAGEHGDMSIIFCLYIDKPYFYLLNPSSIIENHHGINDRLGDPMYNFSSFLLHKQLKIHEEKDGNEHIKKGYQKRLY